MMEDLHRDHSPNQLLDHCRGGGGFAIGIAKGRRLEGLLLGVFLSIVGWIVVSLLPNKLPNRTVQMSLSLTLHFRVPRVTKPE